MGLCDESKNKHLEIMKTSSTNQTEDQKQKQVNNTNTYESIQNLVL